MFKYLVSAVLLICAGCQTTSTQSAKPTGSTSRIPSSEKLLMRVEKIIDTYEVTVQHAVLRGADRSDREQWGIDGRSQCSGYPNSWRSTPGLFDLSDEVARAKYQLNGEQVEVAVRPGTHLISKVIPDSQNSARIIGVFIIAEMTPLGLDVCSMPFDVSANMGQVVVLYQKDAPALSVQ